MKIVINCRYGGYSLSKKAYKVLGLGWDNYGYVFKEDRTNPKLVEVIEKLGSDADGRHASLKVVEIPDDVEWEIENYDGVESIHKKHRSWN